MTARRLHTAPAAVAALALLAAANGAAQAPPAPAAQTEVPGPAPGRVFGFYDPQTRHFTPAISGDTSAGSRAFTRGTITVFVSAKVAKPDPTGSLGCSVSVSLIGNNLNPPLQTDAAESTDFRFDIPWVYDTSLSGSTGTLLARCYAYTADGEQQGTAQTTIAPTSATEKYYVTVNLQ